MDTNQIMQFFTGASLIHVFFKAFAIVLSFLFVLYAIISLRQIKVMNETLKTTAEPVLAFLAFTQLIIAIIVAASAFLLL